MSMFPDCRSDDAYNEDFLNKMDKEFIAGFDCCLEQIKNLIENNLEVYESELDYVPEDESEKNKDEVYSNREDLFEIVRDNAEIISCCIEDWAESERDQIITSLIENMDEKELIENRKKVFEENKKAENPKEYYNTRKYAITGKKVFTEEM